MSQQNWLSQIAKSSPMTPSIAQEIAASLIERNRSLYGSATMTAPQGGETGGEGAGGQANANAGGAGGEETHSSGQQSSTPEGDPQKKISALEEEKERHFQARKAAEEELNRYKTAEEEAKRAAQDEVTNLKQDYEKATTTISELSSALDAALVDNAFLVENTFAWQNPAQVLKLVNREKIQIQDGKVVGVKDALEELSKTDPYLLKTQDDSSQESAEGGRATGQQHNGRRNTNDGRISREDLARKYPALRR